MRACGAASARQPRPSRAPPAAGPIVGTDIRSALIPPPGLYGGTIQAFARTHDFLGGDGKVVPGLEKGRLTRANGGPFAYYVPNAEVFGGAVAVGGFLPVVNLCGRLFAGTERKCQTGLGDPYVEVDWGRFFGTWRPSADAGAYPIPEGLAVTAGLGVVVPIGRFEHPDPLEQTLSPGNNIWDVAPSLALTWTTPPLIAEGTEFSGKFYWNNYWPNGKTDYRSGDVLGLDFAVTEHVGRFQLGLAGAYALQVENDRLGDLPVGADGRRGEILQVGGIVAYDLPERAPSLKLKATTTAFAKNTVSYWSVVTAWVTKF